jgi:hypothetical protein
VLSSQSNHRRLVDRVVHRVAKTEVKSGSAAEAYNAGRPFRRSRGNTHLIWLIALQPHVAKSPNQPRNLASVDSFSPQTIQHSREDLRHLQNLLQKLHAIVITNPDTPDQPHLLHLFHLPPNLLEATPVLRSSGEMNQVQVEVVQLQLSQRQAEFFMNRLVG